MLEIHGPGFFEIQNNFIKKNAFDLNIKPDYAQTGLNMENYITKIRII